MVRVRGRDGSAITLPGVAPVAMQQGRYAARAVRARLQGRAAPPFRYRDKGNLATIGRAAAVADIKGVKLSGFLAWMTWLVVHLFYLVGFQNRLLVLIRRRPPLLPGGLPEPPARPDPLVLQLCDARPRRAADLGPGRTVIGFRSGARVPTKGRSGPHRGPARAGLWSALTEAPTP